VAAGGHQRLDAPADFKTRVVEAPPAKQAAE